MAEDLHSFIAGNLWLKLKADVRDLRVFNHGDLVAAAYFHVRRLLLIQPGWTCRTGLRLIAPAGEPALPAADLALFANGDFQGLLLLDFHLKAGNDTGFPASEMNERMSALRRAVGGAEQLRRRESGRAGRGYLLGVFDTGEEWFYPDQPAWEKQSCFWLPVNCRQFADHGEWRPKWDRAARLSP
jgi:hypothetical protein